MLEATGLTPYFDTVIAAEDVGAGKPDPQVFLAAASRLGASPSKSGRCRRAVTDRIAARRIRFAGDAGLKPGAPYVTDPGRATYDSRLTTSDSNSRLYCP
jgi:phosphoglycolate phosphatase-like HAD superfamily hydrolase